MGFLPRGSSIPLPHAFVLSLLLVALPTCISATPLSHSLPYSADAPHQAPSPAPSHHHHHHHFRHSLSPSPTPYPSKPSTSPPLSPAKPATPPPPYLPVKPPTKAPAPALAPHTKPPTKAPSPYSKPPTKAPAPFTKPPTKAPALAPYSKPPRKLVAVQGVVYCKNCSYAGVDTLLGASPLSGARVELRCRNTKYMIKKTATTDKNGFFFLQAPKYITTYGAHKCLVFLIQSHNITSAGGGSCSHATNLNGGVSGAFLFLNKKLAPPSTPLPFSLFSVGPFAFEPPKCYKH